MNRRQFLGALVGIIAAPAIVRAASLMPVKALPREMTRDEILALLSARIDEAQRAMQDAIARDIYSQYSGAKLVAGLDHFNPSLRGDAQYVRFDFARGVGRGRSYSVARDRLALSPSGLVIAVNA